jgi:hypothetical protein
MKGNIIPTPAHNYFVPVNDHSEQAWQSTLNDLKETQEEWMAFLTAFDIKDYDKMNETNQLSYYDYMHGILHHDAYHLGQIILLLKFA